MVLLAGCTLARRPSPRYARALDFVELAFDEPVPSIATLVRWAKELPVSLVRSIVAPRSAIVSARGALRRDAAMEGAMAWWRQAADTLGARVLVLPTPTDLSPGTRDREVLRSYFAALDALGRSAAGSSGDDRWVAWQPSGVWTDEETVEEALRNDVVPVLDPIEDVTAPLPRAYARLGSLGARPRLSPSLLEQIVETYRDHDLAYVALRTDAAFKEARALQALARSAPPP